MTAKKQLIMEAIGTASLLWKRYAQQNIHPYGVTLNQYAVMRQLFQKGNLNPSHIAEILFCDRSTATVVLRNMEKKKWIKRDLDPDDHRRFQVSLTTAGLEKYQEIPWSTPENKKSRFQPTACFSQEEKKQLKLLLAKLNAHLEKIR